MSDQAVERTFLGNVSQSSRRRWVLAMYLCAAAVVLWVVFGGDHWSVWLACVPMVAAAVIYFRLVVPIRKSLTEKEDRELDERQLAVRNRAYFQAFRILGLVIFGAVLYGAFAADFGGWGLPKPRTTSDFGTLGILVAFLLGSLPATVAAWNEPDPVPDE